MRQQGTGNHCGGGYLWWRLAAGNMCRKRQRGQSLIIFALSLTVLLGLAGLAVDATRAYDLYARMERAAEAGALAGVLYMPNNYSTPMPPPGDDNSAISRASQEVIKNGFGTLLPNNLPPTYFNCPNVPTSFEVAVCPVSGKINDLQVTITEQLSVVVLGALGVQPITLRTSGQAEYLPPVRLGSRQHYFGDQIECSTVPLPSPPDPFSTSPCAKGAGGNHLQYFMATMNGPADEKQNGDPHVYCEEGKSNPASAGDLDGPSFSNQIYNGDRTNHIQWSSFPSTIAQHCGKPILGGNPGNPDQQPPGYEGEATRGTQHPGGYNYGVVVPPGINSASLWVYNPSLITGNGGLDTLRIYPNMHDPAGNGIASIQNGRYDAPPLYYTITYSLYQVNNTFDRSQDVLVSGSPWAYPPYDYDPGDASLHGCGGQAYYPLWNGSATQNSYYNPGGTIPPGGCADIAANTGYTGMPAPCFQMWCTLATNLRPGVYRLVVEATGLVSDTPSYSSSTVDGWGAHSYALKVCTISTITTPISCNNGAAANPPGVNIFAWNNMEINFTANLGIDQPSQANPATSCVTSNGTPYTCLDLGCIPTSYAGRSVTIKLYDPGDPLGGGGDLYIGVVPPSGSGATVAYPSWLPANVQTMIDGKQVVHSWFGSPGYNEFNGLWLNATATLSSNYTGDCETGASGTGWWQLLYAGTATPNDYIAVEFSLVGSPVHLVPPQLG